MHSKHKGFTIVELAIVLVVIGIILGMAVKGKGLVDAARMKAEVAKFNKFEAAVSIYFAKTNGQLPEGLGAFGGFEPKILVDAEVLTNADLRIWPEVAANSNGVRPTYGFFRCDERILNGPHPIDQGVCVASSIFSGTQYTAGHINARVVCNLEVMKDDENISTGLGQLPGNQQIIYINTMGDNYKDCNNISPRATVEYGFRVF